jgi:hypothetical protein
METKLPDQSSQSQEAQTNKADQPTDPTNHPDSPASSPKKKANSQLLTIIVILLLLIVAGVAGFFVSQNIKQDQPIIKETMETIEPTISGGELTEEQDKLINKDKNLNETEQDSQMPSLPTATLSPQQEMTKDWKSYTDPDCGFTIKYPSNANVQNIPASTPEYCSIDLPDCIIEEQICTTHISYVGPDQPQGPTSLGDGYGVTISVGKKPAKKTVKEMAELYIQRCDPALSAVGPQTIAGINGFSYQCGGLGIFSEFWAPYKNDTEKILSFNSSVTENKAVEYQKTVDLILGSYQ